MFKQTITRFFGAFEADMDGLNQAVDSLRATTVSTEDQLRDLRADHELRIKELQERAANDLYRMTTTKTKFNGIKEFLEDPNRAEKIIDPAEFMKHMELLKQKVEEEAKQTEEEKEASEFMRGLENIE